MDHHEGWPPSINQTLTGYHSKQKNITLKKRSNLTKGGILFVHIGDTQILQEMERERYSAPLNITKI